MKKSGAYKIITAFIIYLVLVLLAVVMPVPRGLKTAVFTIYLLVPMIGVVVLMMLKNKKLL